MTVMKSKDIHVALKRDDCITYLMERFCFSQKEELFEVIRKVNPSEAGDLIQKLEKKQKRAARRERNNNSGEVTGKEEAQQEEQPVQKPEEDIVIVDEEEVNDDETEQEEEDMHNIPNIELLKEQEQELSATLCQLEGKHKEFVFKRRVIVGRLENAQKALRELYRLLHSQEKNVIELSEEYLQCAEHMEDINQERRACEALLNEVRGKISELKKITILVYKNGNFEVENAEIPSISEEEVAAEFGKLVSMPEAEEITIKELKTIARLLRMVKVYEASKCPIELEFDSTQVQRLWETVTA